MGGACRPHPAGVEPSSQGRTHCETSQMPVRNGPVRILRAYCRKIGEVRPDNVVSDTQDEEGSTQLPWAYQILQKVSSELAVIAAPLSDLVRKNCPNAVVWSQECEQAFATLKGLMCTIPVLQSPDFSQFILQTDASDQGVGRFSVSVMVMGVIIQPHTSAENSCP